MCPQSQNSRKVVVNLVLPLTVKADGRAARPMRCTDGGDGGRSNSTTLAVPSHRDSSRLLSSYPDLRGNLRWKVSRCVERISDNLSNLQYLLRFCLHRSSTNKNVARPVSLRVDR